MPTRTNGAAPVRLTFRERVGSRIRTLRRSHELSQSALARRLPGTLDAGQISRWERGQALPSVAHLEALAEVFGISEERLICGCDDP